MKLPVYNQEGNQISEIEVASHIFGTSIKPLIIQEAIKAQRAGARASIAHTKIRSEVRGGGKKPWKQKGTGRARHGSIRSPLWRGGGITFGPRSDRNFKKKINKKVKREALRMTLTDKAQANSLKILDHLQLTESKTKLVHAILANLGINGKKIVLALAQKDGGIIQSARNIAQMKLTAADSLNIVDVVWADIILTTTNGVKKMETVFGEKK